MHTVDLSSTPFWHFINNFRDFRNFRNFRFRIHSGTWLTHSTAMSHVTVVLLAMRLPPGCLTVHFHFTFSFSTLHQPGNRLSTPLFFRGEHFCTLPHHIRSQHTVHVLERDERTRRTSLKKQKTIKKNYVNWLIFISGVMSQTNKW